MKNHVADYVQKVKQKVKEVSVENLQEALSDNKTLVIDVREPLECAKGIVPGATTVPRGVLEFSIFNLSEIKNLNDSDVLGTPIYLYCASGGRSACAALALQELGFSNVFSVSGGIQEWIAKDKKITIYETI